MTTRIKKLAGEGRSTGNKGSQNKKGRWIIKKFGKKGKEKEHSIFAQEKEIGLYLQDFGIFPNFKTTCIFKPTTTYQGVRKQIRYQYKKDNELMHFHVSSPTRRQITPSCFALKYLKWQRCTIWSNSGYLRVHVSSKASM